MRPFADSVDEYFSYKIKIYEEITSNVNNAEFFSKLQGSYPDLTPSEKKVADFLAHNIQAAAFMTCLELGEAAGVSDSTVIRLAGVLEFSGFADMKKTLQGLVLKKLSARDRFSTTMAAVRPARFVDEVYELEKRNIQETHRQNPQSVIDQAVDMLYDARKIYLVGLGVSASLVRFMCSRLSRVGLDVVEINRGGFFFVEKMAAANSEDVMLAVSFPPYSPEKEKLINYMKNGLGGKNILITDRRLGEVQASVDLTLVASSDSLAFANSISGPAMLANMITVGIALRCGDRTLEQMSRNQELAAFLAEPAKK